MKEVNSIQRDNGQCHPNRGIYPRKVSTEIVRTKRHYKYEHITKKTNSQFLLRHNYLYKGHNYMCSTTGHVLYVWHNWSYITCMAQLAMYYMCGRTYHVLHVWHNWPCVTDVAQLAMYYMCGTTGHVLHVWHNWSCITCVAQLAIYYMCGTTCHVLHV